MVLAFKASVMQRFEQMFVAVKSDWRTADLQAALFSEIFCMAQKHRPSALLTNVAVKALQVHIEVCGAESLFAPTALRICLVGATF